MLIDGTQDNNYIQYSINNREKITYTSGYKVSVTALLCRLSFDLYMYATVGTSLQLMISSKSPHDDRLIMQ